MKRFKLNVVERPCLVHRAEVAALLLSYIMAHFGRDFPQGIPSVFIAPRPRSPRAVYEDAPQAVDAPLDAKGGRERGPAQEVGTERERTGPTNLPRGEAFRCLHRLSRCGLFRQHGFRRRFFHLIYTGVIWLVSFGYIGNAPGFPLRERPEEVCTASLTVT